MADTNRTGYGAPSTDDDVEKKRTEVESARDDMSETLGAIKGKLDHKVIMDDIKDRVGELATSLSDKAKSTVHTIVEDVSEHAKETAHGVITGAVDDAKHVVDNVVQTTKETVGGVMDTARGAGSSVLDNFNENRVPWLLIALGSSWLYFKNRDGAASRSRYSGRSTGYGYGNESRDQDGTRSMVDQGKDMVGQAAAAVGDAAGTVKEKAGDVIDSAKDAVGSAMGSAQDAGISIIQTIERNPIPATATALGLTWLYLKNQDENKGRNSDRGAYGRPGMSYSDGDTQSGGIVDKVGDKAAQVSEKVGSAVDAAKDKVGAVTSQARDRAGELTSQAGGTIMRTLQENPLSVGMIAMGIGAGLGLLVPETEQENRLMGRARDRVVEHVQDTAHDIKDKVQSVAGQTLDAAKDTAQHVAREKGLMLDGAQGGS